MERGPDAAPSGSEAKLGWLDKLLRGGKMEQPCRPIGRYGCTIVGDYEREREDVDMDVDVDMSTLLA